MPYYKVEFWTGNEQEGDNEMDAIRKVIQRIIEGEIDVTDFEAHEIKDGENVQ